MENMNETMRETTELVIDVLATYGLDVIGAIVILIIGWWIAGWAKNLTVRGLNKTDKIDAMLTGFLSNAVRYAVIVFTVIAVLDRFGVETTSFVAILGATGLAVGLALQGTLSNVAAGVMLLFFRPFKVGDFIEGGGQVGTVKEVGLFITHISTPDNVEIIIPNNSLWNTPIMNYSFNATRRVDFVFGIGYGDDMDKAMKIINEVVTADERVHADPEPVIVIGDLGASSVDITVRVWCAAGDYWALKWDTLKTVKERFDAEGISIPFPQQDVHLYKAAAE